MSGLEIAGVVLGSLPLVISALEHYADGINTARRYWRYKSEVRSLILQVNTERGIFINTLEQLMVGIVRIEQMAEFLADSGSKMWVEAEVDQKLKHRLRGAYGIYVGNVKGMETSLKMMMEKLALDPDGKPQFDDPSLFKHEFRRLKFSLNKSEYAEQLSALRNHNQALTRLTKQSLELEPSRMEMKSRFCPNYSALQAYARNVFECLRSSLCCACDGHAVKLRLESRTQRIEPENLLEETPFRVIFTSASASAPTPILSKWREADIKVLCKQDHSLSPAPVVPLATKPKSVRQVRFDQPHNQQSSTSTVTLTQPAINAVTTPALAQIQDLCRAIAAAHIQSPLSDPCAGYLLDRCNRKHGIYLLELPINDDPSNQNWAAYTLRQVLTKHASISRPLTQLDKFKIAVDLASSVLQLYKTPWLDESWSEDDVYFVHRPGESINAIYQHPFMYRKLSSAGSNQSSVAPTPAKRVIRNQTLFTLGVLLIEILYGKPVDELQIHRDLDCQGTPGVVWCTAERLIEEEIAFEADPLYSDAVRRCIRCDFNQKSYSLDDHDFQQAVFEGVVAPLEKTLRRFQGLE